MEEAGAQETAAVVTEALKETATSSGRGNTKIRKSRHSEANSRPFCPHQTPTRRIKRGFLKAEKK